jgi:hypothetical protein
MHFNKFSLITLFAILSVSFVNAQVDDNLVPRPGDDRLPGPSVPIVPGPTGTVDDSGHTHTGLDDHGHNGTSTSTSTRGPTSTPVNSSSNAFKNSMGALSLASVFAFFMF